MRKNILETVDFVIGVHGTGKISVTINSEQQTLDSVVVPFENDVRLTFKLSTNPDGNTNVKLFSGSEYTTAIFDEDFSSKLSSETERHYLFLGNGDSVPFYDSEIEDIKIDVLDGTHYQFSGTYVIPENNFNGELVLRIKVSDESDHSQTAQFKINVTPVNDAPTALSSLTEFAGTQGELIEMTLADFSAEDVDNTYPDDFTLKILAGTHYETLASGIQTSIDFSGNLTVPVAVNDGEFNSDTLQLTIPIALIAATPDLHSIQLFPNPATDYINFKNSPGDLSIIIRDLNGKELLKETPRNNDHCLDIRNLPNGTYLLELNSSKNQYQQKIIIKH